MLTTNAKQAVDVADNAKFEFYKLIGEGFQAIQEGHKMRNAGLRRTEFENYNIFSL